MRVGGVVLVGLFCWGVPCLPLLVFRCMCFVIGLSLLVFRCMCFSLSLVFRYWTCMSFSLSLYFYGFFVVGLFQSFALVSLIFQCICHCLRPNHCFLNRKFDLHNRLDSP